jgi:RHS repeat-associated protein
LLIQERDTNNNVLVTYTRGLDLGGGLQNAGGVGGLLGRTDANGSTFYHADGSGNIMALENGYQNIVAQYLYNPFGQIEGQWGPLAGANTMQFSSMPYHNLSGLSLYPFRAYVPNLQRWLNQDPIQETGGINLYGFVGNSPVNFIDPFGLSLSDDAGDYLGGEIFGPQRFFNNVVSPTLGWIDNQIDNMRQSQNPPVRAMGGGLYGLSMVWGGPELKTLNEARDLEKAAKLKQLELPLTPARPGDAGKTSGVLCDKKGNQFPLISGRNGVALGLNHSKVTMVVGCGSRWLGIPPFVNQMPDQSGNYYATIGAGPIHHMLVSGLNRPRDIQLSRNKFSAAIPDPAGMSDDDFIGKLIAANAAYPNNLPYVWFPTHKGKGYNSNGYASGILLYVTGSMPPRPPHTPGFTKPVPASDF